MKTLSLSLALTLLTALAAPAQTLTVLLPALDWPSDTVTPSTKGCIPATDAATCSVQE